MKFSAVIATLCAGVAFSNTVFVSADGLRKACHQFRGKNSCEKHDDRCAWPVDDTHPDFTGCVDKDACIVTYQKSTCKRNGCAWASFSMGAKEGNYCLNDHCQHIYRKSDCQGDKACFWKKNTRECVHEQELPVDKWFKCLEHGENHSHFFTGAPLAAAQGNSVHDFFHHDAWNHQFSMQKYSLLLLMNPGVDTMMYAEETPLLVVGSDSEMHGPVVTLKSDGYIAFYPAGLDYPDASITSKHPLPVDEDSLVILSFDLYSLKLKIEVYGYKSGREKSEVYVHVPYHEYHLLDNMITFAPGPFPVHSDSLAVNGVMFAVDEYLKAKHLFCAH